MDATMTDGQASNLRPLPERTRAPVRNAERLEFLSKDWVDAVRAYLAPRVAERRNALVGKHAAVCEMFTDAPGAPRLRGQRGGLPHRRRRRRT